MTGKTKLGRFTDIIEQTLADTDYEALLIDYKREGSDFVLRTLIDHPDGVTIEHCQKASHLISDALELDDPVPDQAYRIEVSSPGVDRPLLKAAHYQRFIGERAFVKTHAPLDGHKKFTGELLSCNEQTVAIQNEHDQQTYQIPLDQIAKATLKPILSFS